MKKLLLLFILWPAIVLAQPVRFQWGTTNTGVVLTNIVKSLATNVVTQNGGGGSGIPTLNGTGTNTVWINPTTGQSLQITNPAAAPGNYTVLWSQPATAQMDYWWGDPAKTTPGATMRYNPNHPHELEFGAYGTFSFSGNYGGIGGSTPHQSHLGASGPNHDPWAFQYDLIPDAGTPLGYSKPLSFSVRYFNGGGFFKYPNIWGVARAANSTGYILRFGAGPNDGNELPPTWNGTTWESSAGVGVAWLDLGFNSVLYGQLVTKTNLSVTNTATGGGINMWLPDSQTNIIATPGARLSLWATNNGPYSFHVLGTTTLIGGLISGKGSGLDVVDFGFQGDGNVVGALRYERRSGSILNSANTTLGEFQLLMDRTQTPQQSWYMGAGAAGMVAGYIAAPRAYFTNIGPNKLVGTDGLGALTNLVVGSGLTLSAGVLTSSGGASNWEVDSGGGSLTNNAGGANGVTVMQKFSVAGTVPSTVNAQIIGSDGSGILSGGNLTFNAAGSIAVKGIATNVRSVSGTDSATANDYLIKVDATGGGFTLTLPASPATGQLIVIKKMNTANTVTIARAGSQTIDGATSVSLTTQYSAFRLQFDGTNWLVE